MTHAKRTPLYELHKKAGARFVEFNGWEMPVYYSNITEEHKTVRSQAGLFDISHMGQFLIEGPTAETTLQSITCNDVRKLDSGRCQYSAFLYENGTFVDDIVIYKHHDQKYMICVNAGNAEKDFEWVQNHLQEGTSAKNVSDQYALLALQGPQAEDILRALAPDPQSLKTYHFMETQIHNTNVLVSRTGYTGEDGFEFYIPSRNATNLWTAIMEAGKSFGLKPIGLGARDTLRLEASYSLYGHEIDDQTLPWEAKLGWIVKMNGEGFIGKEALAQAKEQTPKKVRIGIEMTDKGIARQGYPIEQEGRVIGQVTSGTLSPTFQKAIAIGYVTPDCSEKGTKIQIDIRGKKRNANIVALPFYKRKKPLSNNKEAKA